MSLTSKTTQYMLTLKAFSDNENALNKFVIHAGKDATSKSPNNDFLDFNVNKFDKVDRSIKSNLNAAATKVDLSSDLQASGLDFSEVNVTQRRELQWAKMYVEKFRPEEDFGKLLGNAADNIRKSSYESGLDPSILGGITFGNGGSFGREMNVDEIANAVQQSPVAVEAMSKIEQRCDLYFQSRGSKMTFGEMSAKFAENVKDFVSGKKEMVMGVVLATALTAGAGMGVSHMTAPEAPIYTQGGITFTMDVKDDATYGDVAKEFFNTADVSSEREDIAALLVVSGIAENVSEANTLIDTQPDGESLELAVPDQGKQTFLGLSLAKRRASRDSMEASGVYGIEDNNNRHEETIRAGTIMHMRMDHGNPHPSVPLEEIDPEYAVMAERMAQVEADLEAKGIQHPGFSDATREEEQTYLVHMYRGLNEQNMETAVTIENVDGRLASVAEKIDREAEMASSYESSGPSGP